MFLRIPISGIKKESKKKMINSCGSQFDAKMREIWCLEDLGEKGGATILSFVAATFETLVIYSGGRMVIDYRS